MKYDLVGKHVFYLVRCLFYLMPYCVNINIRTLMGSLKGIVNNYGMIAVQWIQSNLPYVPFL